MTHEFARLLSVFAVWLLVVISAVLVLKVRRQKHRTESQRMTIEALKGILKLANDDYKTLQAQKYVVEEQLRGLKRFNYDLEKAPSGTLQLLTSGGTRLIEPLGSVKRAQDMGIVAWALVANRDTDEEIRLGLVPPR